MLTLLLAVLFGLRAGAAQAATAPVIDAHIAQHIGEITEWAVAGRESAVVPSGITNTTTNGIPHCGTVCSDAWVSEHRPIPGQPSSETMWRNLNAERELLRTRVGLVQGFSKFAGRALPAIGAAQVGWWIGSQLRPLFYSNWVPGDFPSKVTVVQWRYVSKGEVLLSAYYSSGSKQIKAPEDGLMAETTPGLVSGLDTADCPGWPLWPNPDPPVTGGRGRWLTEHYDYAANCEPGVMSTQQMKIGVYWYPYEPFPPTLPPLETSPQVKPQNPETSPEPARPATVETQTETTIEQAIQTELTTKPGDYPHTRPWIDSVTSGTSPDPIDDPEGDPNSDPTADPDPTPTPDPGTDPGPGGSGFTPPALPGINLAPLMTAAGPACNSFPFGIPCYVVAAVGGMSGTGHAPDFRIQLPRLPGQSRPELHIDLAAIQPAIDVLRPLFLLMSFVGIAMWLARKSSNNEAADSD